MKPRKHLKFLRDLERMVGAEIDAELRNSGHLKLTINGNVSVNIAATPSDWRAQKNMVRDIRRAMGQ